MLNVSPDHLDRHTSFEEYQETKWRLFDRQTAGDWAILNADESFMMSRASQLQTTIVTFSVNTTVQRGVWVDDGMICSNIGGERTAILNAQDVRIPGRHNLANVLAATAVGVLCGCDTDDMRQAISGFSGAEHVLEFVREHQGVKYYNDSKGTNVDATEKALASFDGPIVLIAGGKDKGGDFSRLAPCIQNRVRAVIVIGEAAPRLSAAVKSAATPVFASSLQDAIAAASDRAVDGDVVLFSPACASFDMFRNYDHRGKEFKRLVMALS